MSRPPRFSYARAVHHVTLRCNNREFLFTLPSFELFLEVLQEARAQFPVSLYNYCLMTNHVHLLLKVGRADTLSKAMHWISTSFTRRFNKLSGRNGHLWEGRFRSALVEQASYFLRCMAYLDLNPVRAKMAATPLQYRWCGHRALRCGNAAVLDFHPLYLELGSDARTRSRAYAKILAEEAKLSAISLATAYFVGRPRFIWRMEKKFGLGAAGSFVEHQNTGSGAVCVRPRMGGAAVSH